MTHPHQYMLLRALKRVVLAAGPVAFNAGAHQDETLEFGRALLEAEQAIALADARHPVAGTRDGARMTTRAGAQPAITQVEGGPRG